MVCKLGSLSGVGRASSLARAGGFPGGGTRAARWLAALMLAMPALLWAGMAQAAAKTWTGATDVQWNLGANWSALPVSGDSLVFGAAGTGGTLLSNNLTSGSFSIAGITFNAGAAAFVIGDGTTAANAGNTFALTGSVINNGTSLETINNPFSMTAVRTFTTSAGGGDITLGGNISGSGGGITKTGLGTLTLTGANTWTSPGATTVTAGTLKIVSTVTEPFPTSGLTLGGTLLGGGTFIYDNAGATDATTLTLPYVNFSRAIANDNVVQVTRTAAQNVVLTITDLQGQNIENGHNVNLAVNDVAGGGVNGTNYKIVLSDQTAYKITQTNVYFNGSDFAVYDAGPDGSYTTAADGFVRGIKYGVDAASATSAGGLSFGATTSQEITGNITAQPSVTLGGGTLNGSLKIVGASSVTMSSSSQTLTFTGSGNTGTNGFLKTGGGTSVIGGGSAISMGNLGVQADFRVDGPTDVLELAMPVSWGGTTRLMKSGQGTLIFSSGTIAMTDSRNPFYVDGGIVEIGGTATLNDTAAAFGLAAGALLKHSSSSTTSVSAVAIDGYGGVTVSNGMLTLSGNNTYTGATTITGGALQIGNGGATGSLSASSAVANDGTLIFNRAGTLTFANAISGSGAVTKIGPGTVVLTGANSYTGNTAVNEGFLQLSPSGTNTMLVRTISRGGVAAADFKPGTGVIQTTTVNTNGIIGAWATYSSNDWAVGSPDGTLTNVTAATYTNTSAALDDPANYAGNHMNVDSSQAPTDAIAPGSLRFNTAAAYTLTLQGSNTIASGGILIGTGVGNNLSKITGGTLTTGTELIVTQNNTANSLEIGSGITGSCALTKSSGAGTLVLSGANSYSGITTVNAGTVNLTGSLTGGTAITVGALGTFTQGSDSVISGGSSIDIGGTATLAGNNLYSGGTTIRSGATLAIGADNNLGAPGTALNFNGGTLSTGANVLTLTGRAVNLGTGGGTFTNTTGGNLTIDGALTGATGLSKLGTGTLSLTGTSNLTTTNGTLLVNGGGSLVIKDGGKLTNGGTAKTGQGNGQSNNVILVTDSGSSWTCTGRLQLGDGASPNDNTLTVNHGATASFGEQMWIGSSNSPQRSALYIDGANSVVNAVSTLQLQAGTGSIVRITNSGKLLSTSGSLVINDCGAARVTIDGTGSLAQFGSNLQLQAKSNGGASWVTVQNGGTLATVGSSYISNTSSVGNNQLTVTNAGSLWTNTGAVSMEVTSTVTTGSSLIISDKGKVGVTGNLTLGSSASSNKNTASVSGGGVLEIGGTLTVGQASSMNNAITANTGGVLQFTAASPTIVIGAGMGNAVTIDGGVLSYKGLTSTLANVNLTENTTAAGVGKFTWSGANTFRLDNASTTVASSYALGGTGTTYNAFDLLNSSTLTINDLTVGAGSAINFAINNATTGAGDQSKILGSGTLALGGNGTLNLAFSGTGYSAGFERDLFYGYGSITGTFASVTATGLTDLIPQFIADGGRGYVKLVSPLTDATWAGGVPEHVSEWNQPGNWTGSGSLPPSGIGAMVTFGSTDTTEATVTPPATDTTIGQITFKGKVNTTIEAVEDGTLNLNNGTSAPAVITVEHGTAADRLDTIATAMALGSQTLGARNLEITVQNSADQLTLSGSIEGPGSIKLTDANAGKVVLGGVNFYSGGTTVSGGTLVIGSAGALPVGKSLSIGSGGTLILGGGMAMGQTLSAEPVPEPGTLALLAIAGLAGAMLWRRRK